MGVNRSSHLIFGVPINRKSERKPVIRYNNVTGEPYETMSWESDLYIGDTDILFDDGVFGDNYDELRDNNIIFTTDGSGYFGVVVTSVDGDQGEAVGVNLSEIAPAQLKFFDLVSTYIRDTNMEKTLLANIGVYLVATVW